MTRAGGGWVPDGRAKAIRADCEASLAALDGLPIDLYLLHAPDPRTPWRTSVRALARLADEGLVRRVGVANVNRAQLDEALELAPIAAVQVALSPFDERALRGGVVERCDELGHRADRPLAARRAAARGRARATRALAELAAARGATPAEVALAWLLGAVAGRRRDPGRAAPGDRALGRARGGARARRGERAASLRVRRGPARAAPPARTREVVLVMGIPGAGKSRVAAGYVERGYVRLNRDERGGSLRDLAAALDEALAAGARAGRPRQHVPHARVAELRRRGGRAPRRARCAASGSTRRSRRRRSTSSSGCSTASARCPRPRSCARSRARAGPARADVADARVRELEPPSADEGFAAVERVPFVRGRVRERTRAGVFVAAAALRAAGARDGPDPDAPHLVFDWRPDGAPTPRRRRRAPGREVAGPVEAAVCPHPRRPADVLVPAAAARASRSPSRARHGVDPARSILVGTSTAHRTLADDARRRLRRGVSSRHR